MHLYAVVDALTGRFKELGPDEFANVMWVLALRTDLPVDVEQVRARKI